MGRGITAFLTASMFLSFSAWGDPPLKTVPENFELQKHDDFEVRSPPTKTCLPCLGLKQVAGFQKSQESAHEIEDVVHVNVDKTGKVTFNSVQTVDAKRGVTYNWSKTLSTTVGSVGHTKTKGANISSKFGGDNKPNDFSEGIKSVHDKSLDNN